MQLTIYHPGTSAPPGMAAGRVMKRIRADKPRIRRERAWTQDPPADPRDPDVVRVKARARAPARLVPGQPGSAGERP